MKNTAHLSSCRTYRYTLWRTWDDTKDYVMFIGLNPSTADEKTDNPTLIRCMNYAKSWGFGGVCVANLFAYRATQPQMMKAAKEPIGIENDIWLQKIALDAGLIIAAWGNDGSYLNRSEHIKNLLPKMHCLKINKSGEPAHPLYQTSDKQPIPMQP